MILSHFGKYFIITSKSPYKILGISQKATNDEVKQAYLNLSKQYHPDLSQSKETEMMFKLVQEAYRQILHERQTAKERDEQLRKEFEEFKKQQSQSQNFAYEIKHDVYTGGVKPDNWKLYIILGAATFLLGGSYLLFKKKEDAVETISQEQIKKAIDRGVQIQEAHKEIVKNSYRQEDERILPYESPEPDAFKLLTYYTIYPDLKLYWVHPTCFAGNEADFITSNNFEKKPMEDERLNMTITYALEAERILQNIFVKVDDVISQIEKNGDYKPPGVFMKFFGYVYFRIRHKPIVKEHLMRGREYISLFDLYFKYKSPVPYFHNKYTEFQLVVPHSLTSKHPQLLPWLGNAHLSSKSIPRLFLKGDVKNVFIHRIDLSNQDEQRYFFVWNKFSK